MRPLTSAILLLTTCIVKTVYPVEQPSALKVDVSTDREEYHPRDPIICRIAITNTATERVRMTSSPFWRSCAVKVLFNSTEDVSMTAFGSQALIAARLTAIASQELAPGETIRFSIEIDRLYDVSRSGSYEIRIGATAHLAKNSGVSNTGSTRFTITPSRTADSSTPFEKSIDGNPAP